MHKIFVIRCTIHIRYSLFSLLLVFSSTDSKCIFDSWYRRHSDTIYTTYRIYTLHSYSVFRFTSSIDIWKIHVWSFRMQFDIYISFRISEIDDMSKINHSSRQTKRTHTHISTERMFLRVYAWKVMTNRKKIAVVCIWNIYHIFFCTVTWFMYTNVLFP